MMGALVEGDITPADFDTTGIELPKLYEGRATPGTLIWCRSNRSGRFFNAARDALIAGTQPDAATLAASCYLMRNTGLDGNGTFGTKTFLAYEADHPLRWSLAAQMLSAYMMRVFAQDLVASPGPPGESVGESNSIPRSDGSSVSVTARRSA